MTATVQQPATSAKQPSNQTPTPRRQPAGQPPTRTQQRVQFGNIDNHTGHRIAIYGPGGIGKTSLAAAAPGPVAFFDLDDSLHVLRPQLPEDVQSQISRVGNITGWEDVRRTLRMPGWDEIRTIVIDSATRAEELAVAWTLANIPHEKRDVVIRRVEDYGFGKGYQHIYETFLKLLNDLDQHAQAGRNVVLLCHECTSNVPNPNGDDWLRYEPRLQTTGSGKASIRLRVKEWADHLLFVGYDVDVREGKGTGSGTRTIYPTEQPHCMAKSRTLADAIPFERDDRQLWESLFPSR